MNSFNKLYNLILQSIITEGIAEVQQILLKYKSKPVVKKLIAQLKEIPEKQNRNKKANLIAHFISKGDKITDINTDKVQKAFAIIDRRNVDLKRFDSLKRLLEVFGPELYMADVKKNYMDPDKIPEFTDKEVCQNGVVTYQVQNDKAGQEAVRKVVDAHWGPDANPWCIIARKNGTLRTAQKYWYRYNYWKKRIAFQKGKLLAFFAHDTKDPKWWDREDKSAPVLKDFLGNYIKTKEYEKADIKDIYRLKLNPETQRYDSPVTVEIDRWNCDEWVDKNGDLKYPLGNVKGNFWLRDASKLKSLKNCPISVGREVHLDKWQGEDFTSLNGALQEIGWLISWKCVNLKTLKGLEHINAKGMIFFYGCDNLQSIEGLPNEVHSFAVTSHSLKTLVGGPTKVKEKYSVRDCTNLRSLQGCPEEIPGSFDCSHCDHLRTLKGGPKRVEGNFYCNNCKHLISLQGGPQYVGGGYDCDQNYKLMSFKGIAKEIGGTLDVGLKLKGSNENRDQSELQNIKAYRIIRNGW